MPLENVDLAFLQGQRMRDRKAHHPGTDDDGLEIVCQRMILSGRVVVSLCTKSENPNRINAAAGTIPPLS